MKTYCFIFKWLNVNLESLNRTVFRLENDKEKGFHLCGITEDKL